MGWIIGGVVVVLLAAIIGLTALEDSQCQKAGGEMLRKTVGGVGVTSSGDVGPTFSTVSFCVTKDGRILY